MKKTRFPKTEKVGYIIRSVYIVCPYCSESNSVTSDNPLYLDDDVQKFMCKFCKFSFRVEEIKNA